jgi:hypothetical protein
MEAENRRLAAIRLHLHRKIGSYRSEKRALRRHNKETTWRLRTDTAQLLQKDDMLALLAQISPSIEQRTDDFASMAKLSLEEFQRQLHVDLGPGEEMWFVPPAAVVPQMPPVPSDQQLPELPPSLLLGLPELPAFSGLALPTPMHVSSTNLSSPLPPQHVVFSATPQPKGARPRPVPHAAQNAIVQPPVASVKRARVL